MHAVGYVVPSWSPTRLADGQIALRTMSWSIDTMTVWATTALVALDRCATQHLFDRRQVAHQSAAAFAQGRSGECLQVHRTESEICPIESELDSSVNPESGQPERGNELGELNQTEG